MGDRIAILNVGGVLEQFDTPAHILGHPASDMVADFVGSDRALKRLRVTEIDPEQLEHPPALPPDATLAEAREAMARADAPLVAVVDENDVLCGVVRGGACRRRRTCLVARGAGGGDGPAEREAAGRAGEGVAHRPGVGGGRRRCPLRGRAHPRVRVRVVASLDGHQRRRCRKPGPHPPCRVARAWKSRTRSSTWSATRRWCGSVASAPTSSATSSPSSRCSTRAAA